MKNFELLKAITSIDDSYVEDALKYKCKKAIIYKQVIAFASAVACMCIVLFGAIFAYEHFATKPTPDITSDFVIENGTLVAYTGSETEITLPDEVITIASNAFSSAENANYITSISLNSSVSSIDEKAFSGLSSLNNVTVPESNSNFIFTDGVLMATDGSIHFSTTAENAIDVQKFVETLYAMESSVDFIGKRTEFVFGELTVVAQNIIYEYDPYETRFVIESFSVFGQTFNLSDSQYDSSLSDGVIERNAGLNLILTDDVFVYSKTRSPLGYYLIITEDTVYEYANLTEILPGSEEAKNNPTWYNDRIYRFDIDESGRLWYICQPRKYLQTQQFFDQIRYCVSLDEIAMEEGYVTFVDGAPVYYPEKTHTANEVYDIEGIFNDWYTRVTTDENITDDYFTLNEIPKVSSLEELLAYNKKHYVKVFDPNDEANLPFRLAGMTFAEIEAEFGPLEYPYMMYGGSPVYTSEKLPGIKIVYISADSALDNGWPAAAPYETPDRIDVVGGEYYIYPGIYSGMPAEELVKFINDYKVTNANPLRETTYDIMATINDTYGLRAGFKIPSEMYDEFLDYYHSVENDIDPHDGWLKLLGEFEEELANNLSGELLGYSIYG